MTEHPGHDLTAYAMGDLPPQARARVAAHLDGCAACREALAQSRLVLDGLAAGLGDPPPIDWEQYRAQLRVRRQAASRRRRWSSGWPAVAAAGVAAAGLLLGIHGLVGQRQSAGVEDALVARLPLLQDYRVVERLDLLEDLDAIRHLDRLAGVP
jgi:anti-sigma factor RsiW